MRCGRGLQIGFLAVEIFYEISQNPPLNVSTLFPPTVWMLERLSKGLNAFVSFHNIKVSVCQQRSLFVIWVII